MSLYYLVRTRQFSSDICVTLTQNVDNIIVYVDITMTAGWLVGWVVGAEFNAPLDTLSVVGVEVCATFSAVYLP